MDSVKSNQAGKIRRMMMAAIIRQRYDSNGRLTWVAMSKIDIGDHVHLQPHEAADKDVKKKVKRYVAEDGSVVFIAQFGIDQGDIAWQEKPKGPATGEDGVEMTVTNAIEYDDADRGNFSKCSSITCNGMGALAVKNGDKVRITKIPVEGD